MHRQSTTRSRILFAGAITLAGIVTSVTFGLIRAQPLIIDLATQSADTVLVGAVRDDEFGNDVFFGDVDGNGRSDLIVSAPWADSGKARTNAGKVYVFFDRPTWPDYAVAETLADVIILGEDADDSLPAPINAAGSVAVGDLNGDGFGDLVLGAPEAMGHDGKVYVLFGRPRAEWPRVIDLAESGADVEIFGSELNSAFGSAVATGDLNADGRDDLIVGVERAPGPQGSLNAGRVYAFWGRSEWPSSLDLRQTSPDLTVWGKPLSFLGRELTTGDLNGDGREDLVLGAVGGNGPQGERRIAGEVHVLFADPELSGTIDLSQETGGWVLYGAAPGDELGHHLAVGDVNGDGYQDLVLGIPGANAPGRDVNAGQVVVVYGPMVPGVKDLTNGADVVIYGRDAAEQTGPDWLGDGLAVGDINGDGTLDIVAGAREGDGPDNNRHLAGEAYVFFGGALPSVLDLATDAPDMLVYGRASGDLLGRVAVGDVNGDGAADLALGATQMGNPGQTGPGAVFIIFGVPAPTATATVTATPTSVPLTPTPTPTPTATLTVTPTPPLGPRYEVLLPLLRR